MNLTIKKEATISAIQQDFHHYFPYLKIEIFMKSHELHELSKEKQHLPANTSLSAIATLKGDGVYEFSAEITTGLFEQGLWDSFGLGVQVMRKSGHIWLQTAQTDDWSLAKQNEVGRDASAPTTDEVGDYTLRDIE